jgi:SAM-dependent methyltransferase
MLGETTLEAEVRSMEPKPVHLGADYGRQFSDQSVVDHYHLRPPYPDAVFPILAGLVTGSPRVVLDVGTGTGEIARRLAPLVERVDAVDLSPAMIERARRMPGGDSDRIAWTTGPAETAPLRPPYGLVTAAASLHWMEWKIVLPRFRESLLPGGRLACVSLAEAPRPWWNDLLRVIGTYSTNRHYRPYDTIEEIERRGLFRTIDRVTTPFEPFTQSVEDYIGSIHARNGFSLDRMDPADAAAFDQAATSLVEPCATEGMLTFEIAGEVIWGEPLPLPVS